MEFCTKNYLIRNLTETDTKSFFKIAKDAMVKMYVPYAYCSSLKRAKENMGYYAAGDCKNDFYLAIEQNGQMLGIIIANKRADGISLELAYFVAKEYRCRGVMSESIRGFCNWLKENTNYEYLFLAIKKSNIPSCILAAKLNAKICGGDLIDHFYRLDLI